MDGAASTASTSDSLSSEHTTRDQVWTVEITPSDDLTTGPSGIDSLTISNSIPEASDVAISPSGASTEDVLSCSYSFTDADSDADASSIEWDIDGSTAGTGDTLSSGYTGGSVVTCTVTPNDGTDAGTAVSDSISIENTVPVLAEVTLSPDPAFEGDTLTCAPGETTDADGTTSFSYSTTWTVDGSDPGETGDTLSSEFFERDQAVTCFVTPHDGTEDGEEVISNTVTIENTEPSIDQVSITPDPATAFDALSCSYSGWWDEDGDSDASTTYAWAINGSDVGTGTSLSSGYIGGDTVRCTVTPGDGTDSGEALSASLEIENSAPVLASVSLSPTTAYEADTLTCTPDTATDADGESVTYRYAWTVDGSELGETGDTLTGDDFDRDQEVLCTVTPSDGTEDGDPVDSNAVTISNTAPSATVTISPDPAYAADTLECSWTFFDDDGDSDASTLEWSVDGTVVGTDTTLSGAFVGSNAVKCAVTPSDGTDTGSIASSTITIDNTPPVLSGVLLSPDPAYEADTLSCAPYETTDVDGTLSFSNSHNWTVNGTDTGTHDSSLTGDYFDRGDEVICTITPSDYTDEGDPVDSNAVTIGNSAPVISSVSIDPDPATTEDVLLCDWSFSDDDGDGDESTLEWTVNGTSAGTDATLSGAFVYGDEVICTVRPHDGTEAGSSESASVTISNTAPVLSDVSLSPDPATEEDTLTCTAGDTTDADGAVGFDYSYAWEVNGVDIAETADTLDGDGFDKGDEVVCIVTPSDGDSEGDPVESNTVTIGNTAPTITSLWLSDTSPGVGDSFDCKVNADDVDGENLTISTSFTPTSGAAVETTSCTASAAPASCTATMTLTTDHPGGSEIQVSSTVTDEDGATSTSTTTIVIENSAPEVTEVTLSPSTVYTDDTLTASVSSSDDDGDSVSLSYDWYVDGSLAASGSDTSLSGVSYFDKNEEVYVVVTPSDGSEDGDAVSSDSIIVSNTAPSLSSVAISPDPATTADTLTCAASGFADDDGDSDSSTLQWSVNGTDTHTGSTLSSTLYEGDVVACTATAHDGEDEGNQVSASLTVDAATLADSAYSFIGEDGADLAGVSVASGDFDGDGLDDIVVGASGTHVGSYYYAGVAYIILGKSLGSTSEIDLSTADYKLHGEYSSDSAGHRVASADVDGDGREDVLIGAYQNDAGGSSSGCVYIIKGSSLGSTSSIYLSSADYQLYGASGDESGKSLAGAGDVDGDGRDDIIVGATGMSSAGSNSGGAYIVLGASLASSSSIDLSSSADYELLGENANDDAGYSVAGAGDVDADGLDDVIVGARSENGGGFYASGSAYIVLGSSLGSSSSIDLSSADYKLTGEAKHDSAGYSVAGAGDVNGDGRHDVLVGARNNSNGGYNSGTAYLVLGSSLGSTSTIALSSTYKLVGEAAYDTAGESVASAGDVDGDGLDDILIGAQNNDDGGSSAGKAYIILGKSLSGSINLSAADIQLAGENSWDYAGISVATAGDVDGDGYDEILVGAYLNGDGGGSAGKAYLFMP